MKGLPVDLLLRAARLPTTREALSLARSIKQEVEVRVEASKHHDLAERIGRELEHLLRGSRARVVLAEARDWPQGLPEPSIVVGGRLGGRLRFHGVPRSVLLPPFLLAIAAAGGSWAPPRNGVEPGLEGAAVAYLVPGLPCARALYHGLHVVYHSRASLIAVNVESMIEQGLSAPVDTVPAWRTPCGELLVYAPRSPTDAARIWKCRKV